MATAFSYRQSILLKFQWLSAERYANLRRKWGSLGKNLHSRWPAMSGDSPGYRLAAHYFRAVDPFGGIASIDHQLRFSHNFPVIIIRVVRDNKDAVVLAKPVKLRTFHL